MGERSLHTREVGGSKPPVPILNERCSCPWRYRENVSRLERITSDPTICHGQPTIRGLRHTVEGVLELLGARTAGGRVVPLTAA